MLDIYLEEIVINNNFLINNSKKLALEYTLSIIIIMKGRADMNNKKLGFGLMRLPSLILMIQQKSILNKQKRW